MENGFYGFPKNRTYTKPVPSASYALTASYVEGGFSIDTGSLATTGSNNFIGNQNIVGDIIITGSDYVSSAVRFISGATITTLGPNIDMTAGPGGWSEIGSNNGQNYVWVDDNGLYLVTNWDSNVQTSAWRISTGSRTLTAVGDLDMNGHYITGSLLGTASWANRAVTASYAMNGGGGIPGGANTSIQFNNNGAFSGSNNFTFATASSIVSLTGSLKFVATNDPDPIGAAVSASYIFVSSSNTTLGYDLYFRQDGNVVKWKWIEGALSTGLLYGGVLSYSNTGPYNIFVSSGSGLIVQPNATLYSEVNPQIKYVTWGNLSASINTSSFQSTYVYIDTNGNLRTQNTFFTPEQYSSNIPLGMFNHTGRDLITSTTGDVYTIYNTTNQTFDFIQAIGPLKISGTTVGGQTGTLRLNIGAGESYLLGGFYQQDPDNISHKQTNAYLTASIARVYRSGSTFITDNNGGAFYTTIDPTKWDDGTGVLNSVGGGSYTVQRVFFNPVTGRCHVYYGQKIYNTLVDATTNITTEAFTEASYSTHQYVLAGYLVVKGNTTDLTNVENTIVQAGLFRNTVGSSGGSLIPANLGDLGNVSIVSPTNGQPLVYNSGTTKWENSSAITASLFGTASWAQSSSQAISASRATTSSFAISASYAATASFLPIGTYTITASWAQSSSQAISSSFNLSSSYALSSSFAISSSRSTTSSFALTASYAANVAGVNQIIAGTNITISPAGGTGNVTINSTGGGGTNLGLTYAISIGYLMP